MRSSTSIFLTSFFVICGGLSLLSAMRGWETTSLSEQTKHSLSEHATIRTTSFDEEASKLEQLWSDLDAAALSNSEVSFQAGKSTMLSLHKNTDVDHVVQKLCKARRLFSAAIKSSPAEPRYRIALADVDVQLRSPEILCKGDPIDFVGDVEQAIALAPSNTYIGYLAALVHLAADRKAEGLKLLKKNEEINPLFSQSQREFAFRLISSETDLKNALPRRYPEVVYWVEHFRKARTDDYIQWNSVFSSALHEASSELLKRYDSGQISPDLLSRFLKRIAQLPIAESDLALQKKLSPVLSDIYLREGNKTWADFLTSKENLIRIPVLKTVIVDDHSPKLTQLYGWTNDDDSRRVNFDYLGRAIGFYVPRKMRAKTLILQSAEGFSELTNQSIELLQSNDNLHFHQISDTVKIKKTHVDGRETFIIELPNSNNGRYYKLRYAGSDRQPRFENSMYGLIQVYGRTIS